MPVVSGGAARIIRTPIPGRRVWKKIKERQETIWSPELEAALVQALEKYRPGGSPNRILRRFPKRNRFISDHIFAVTGSRRTTKQVGSRLQQMRDTCRDRRILCLLSGREFTPEDGEPNTPSDSCLPIDLQTSFQTCSKSTVPTPAPSTSDVGDCVGSETTVAPPPKTFVTIRLVRPYPDYERRSPISPEVASPGRNEQYICLDYPSEIGNSEPVLTFTTPREISTSHHYSHFRVLIGGVLVHSEVTELALMSTSLRHHYDIDTKRYTYSTKLIPLYWAHLCRSSQLSYCIIEQDIVQTRPPPPFDTLPSSGCAANQSIRCVIYRFSVPPTSSPSFHPPSLPSEPPLPPGFPCARQSTQTQIHPPHSLAPTKYMIHEQSAPYEGDSYAAPATYGLFSGFHTTYTPEQDTAYSLYNPNDFPFLPAIYNYETHSATTNFNEQSTPSTRYDGPMYRDLNFNTF
ncbi:hypothetical protein GGX14DRAFT_583088 [Mycena pura]|uniref:TEA domain-containing protein n=1 Tax=Mycena pura TaxID=153505 RepID=A0AAD6YVI3_9AGAR|nr:hypothetical protein GGX14DRAFT_583088 [Mycena pura]